MYLGSTIHGSGDSAREVKNRVQDGTVEKNYGNTVRQDGTSKDQGYDVIVRLVMMASPVYGLGTAAMT